MSETTTSQMHKDPVAFFTGSWKQMLDDQAQRMNTAFDELTRLQKQGREQSHKVVEEIARVARTQIDHMQQLQDQWQQAAMDATRRGIDMVSPR